MAAGFFAGAVAIGRFGARWRKGRMILFGMLLDGLTYVPFFWVESYALAVALVFVHGFFIPWIVVGRTSLLHHHVAEHRTGKVFSLVHLTVAGMTALSALGAGVVASIAGARVLFLVAGTFGALCGVAGWLAMPRLRSAA
jgi:predicted MFS family arabinose efflux permease